uniref:SPARC/Testican calcium-binding domain-containing protein n=1 Tax=Clastoptera arizonana TaxID=38151 RepID=A0A1B6DH33_9HEMI
MKVKFTLLYMTVIILLIDVCAQKPTKYKKYRPRHHKSTTLAPAIVQELSFDGEKFLPSVVESDHQEEDNIKDDSNPITDPCYYKHCGAGRVCEINENSEAVCNCIKTCPQETDERRKVCSNRNETWNSDCEVYQMRCFCDENNPKCEDIDLQHLHIEYYGMCREMPECKEDEMADFPRRMRDWLFNIMRDLADREELSQHYLNMEREAENNLTKRWSNAAVWKWCDLDGHPHDRAVSIHELFPIRAPLMALEHCIAPFLNSCDKNNDHTITLKEWAKCLELNEDVIEDSCETIYGEDKG